MVWSYPASSTLRLDHLRPSRPIDIIGIDDRHGSESPIDMRRNRRSTWVGLRSREVRITTANVVLLKGEGATWGEALRRRPWSVAGILRPKEL